MKLWLHKIELLVDTTIPYVLFLLIGLLTMNYFLGNISTSFKEGIIIFDYAVMGLFLIDLGFKYHRAREVGDFLKKNWLEIIAVMPFALIFKMFDKLIILSNIEKNIETLNGNYKIETTFIRLVRQLGEESVILRSNRFLQLLNYPKKKIIEAMQFFERPTGKHYHHEKRN